MTIASVIVAFACIADREDMILVGLVIVAGGVLVSRISSLFLYGFDDMIEKTCEIERNTRK